MSWIIRFAPVFDAHLAPYKNKHHYWFGVMLLVRGVLLIVFTVTSTIIPQGNLLILLVVMVLLVSYVCTKQIYQSKLVLILEGFTFYNLMFLSGTVGILHTYKSIYVSMMLAFAVLDRCNLEYSQALLQMYQVYTIKTSRLQ